MVVLDVHSGHSKNASCCTDKTDSILVLLFFSAVMAEILVDDLSPST